MRNDLIKFAPTFMGLADSELEILAQNFVAGRCPSNSVLFKAGDQSEALYLIEKGFVRLTTESGQNLAALGPGSILGDTTLFRGATQDVNAVSVSDVELWKLPDRKLRELVLQNPTIGIKLSQNFGSLLAQMEDYLIQRLTRTSELNGLPRNTLQAIAAQLQPRAIRAQETLYRAGETPGGLYIIEQGSFELRPEPNNGVDQELQRFQPGAILGALALLTNKAYTNTAIALEESLLWVLPPENFQAVNSRHPGLRRSLGRNARSRLGRADQAQAALRLAQMPLFSEVPPQSMQAIAQRMVLQHIPAGERVYRIGEAGDALYLIESGEIELTEENANGVVEEKARISANGFFGEMSLFTGQIRTEDATATRNTNLWILYKSDLDELAVHHPAIGKALSQALASRLSDNKFDRGAERFHNFPLLADLNPNDLKQVSQYLHPTRYRAGEQVYRASTPADALYLLEKGQVRIQPLNGGSWMVGSGEAFGEQSLLTNQPRNASAVAETDADVWTLNKKDFDMLVTRYPSLALNISRTLSQRLSEMPTQYPAYDAGFDDPVAATAPPPPRRQRAAARANMEPQERGGIFDSFSNMTSGAKLRLALLILLVLFILGIVVPFTLISLINGTSGARGASLSLTSRALSAVYSLGSYEVAAADKDLAQAIAKADSAVPPTPTYTPFPTNTPIVIENMAAPAVAQLDNATPMPTLAPLATEPAQVNQVAAALAAIPPTPEPVQAAAVDSRAWDPRLDQLGVTLEEAQVSPGQPYWRLIDAHWADEQQATGTHHIYMEVLDENGKRIVGQPVVVWWGDGNTPGQTEDKAPPDYAWNFQMYAAGYAYNAKVEGLPSDILHGAGMGSIEKRNYGIHVSYYLTFKRSIK